MKENYWNEIHKYMDYLWSQEMRGIDDLDPDEIKKLIVLLIKATPKKFIPCINRIDPENEVLLLIAEMMEAHEKDHKLFFCRIIDRLLAHSEKYYINQIKMLFREKADEVEKQHEKQMMEDELNAYETALDLRLTIAADNKQRM